MADISSGIRSLLVSKAAITNLVSLRVYSGHLPQNAELPAIVYSVISGGHVHHLSGSSNFSNSRMQIDCYAATRAAANSAGEAVRKELTKFSGTAGSETVDTVLALSPRERDEEPKDATDSWRFVHSRDYMVWHAEAAVNT